VLQNCNIFNDGAWREFTEREVATIACSSCGMVSP